MNNKEQDNYSNATLDLIKKFVDSNQRKRINLLTQIESEVENIFNLGPSLFDMFDCVLPTRSGRTGLAFTWDGKVNIRNSKYKKDLKPLDENTNLRSLNKYSKSYLNHLINTNEILASMLISLHNINFYQEFMKKIRTSIKDGSFDDFYKENISKFN